MTTRDATPLPRPVSAPQNLGKSIFPTFAVNVPMPSGTAAPSAPAPAPGQPASGSGSGNSSSQRTGR